MARDRTPSRRRVALLAAATAVLALAGPRTAAAGPPAALSGSGAAASGPPAALAGLPRGHDVSSHQERVDWDAVRSLGARFVYVKATESTDYRNPYFGRQYGGAHEAGLTRGAYHFARPDRSSGARQAAFFLRHGGRGRADGRTLPPALDIEYNPYDEHHKCYGLNRTRMVRWIRSFTDEVRRETGRDPVVYTTAHWWRACTGDSHDFARDTALWIASHGTPDPGELPGGWRDWTFWQYGTEGALPGDQNLFNGSPDRLRALAHGRGPRGD
ncbi:lysozyme [Streptomyces sp. NPDC005573]|uniref:lysozyme n=1 Tax=Streptomyces sp. NPDC005573 TaxID=3156890 RepID=UPI0033BFADE4